VPGAEVLFLAFVAVMVVALLSILRGERREPPGARPLYVKLALGLVLGFSGWLLVGAVITGLTHSA
jgi:hypothetical protein